MNFVYDFYYYEFVDLVIAVDRCYSVWIVSIVVPLVFESVAHVAFASSCRKKNKKYIMNGSNGFDKICSYFATFLLFIPSSSGRK